MLDCAYGYAFVASAGLYNHAYGLVCPLVIGCCETDKRRQLPGVSICLAIVNGGCLDCAYGYAFVASAGLYDHAYGLMCLLMTIACADGIHTLRVKCPY